MQEQRASPRVRVDLNVKWETLSSQGRGTISDLSSTGCFVLSGGEVSPGELVCLQIVSVQPGADFWGQVIYATEEMGFALRFVFANDTDRDALKKLINDLKSSQATNAL